MERRKLTRSNQEKMLAGVCGGIAEYLDLDPTLVRLAFVALMAFGMNGAILYIILMILMPAPVSVSASAGSTPEVVDPAGPVQ